MTERLRDGAIECLTVAGAASDAIEVFDVPGAYEIPFASQTAASTGRFDAVLCLGCLIRGATPHFEYIASAVSHGIMAAAAESGVPMAFGVLTTNTPEEALERAAPDRTNKGGKRRWPPSRWRSSPAAWARRRGRDCARDRQR